MSFFFSVPSDDKYDHLRGNEYEIEPVNYMAYEPDTNSGGGYEYFEVKDMDGNDLNGTDAEYISETYDEQLQELADDADDAFFNEPD